MQNVPLSRLSLALVVALSLLGIAPVHAQDAQTATVTCKDGSSSKAGQGACSHHGGVNKGASAAGGAAANTSTPVAGAKTASTAAAPTAGSSAMTSTTAGANSGAPSAKCKDGTMSYSKTHSGSCSHHGGVAQFFDK